MNYQKQIIGFTIKVTVVIIAIIFTNFAELYSQKYAVKDGLVKLKVVKGLRIEVEPSELYLGIFPQGSTKQIIPAETMTFNIYGHDNAGINCTIITMDEYSAGGQNEVKIGITHSILPEYLDSNGEAQIHLSVESVEVSPQARPGTHVFHQKISVEYIGI